MAGPRWKFISTILVIYDDEARRVTIGRILQFDEHDVALAVDGEGGVRHFCKQTFDLVICDTITSKEGLETFRQICTRSACVPIISILESVTSSGSSCTPPQGFLGMSTELESTWTLAKPFTGSDLLALGALRSKEELMFRPLLWSTVATVFSVGLFFAVCSFLSFHPSVIESLPFLEPVARGAYLKRMVISRLFVAT